MGKITADEAGVQTLRTLADTLINSYEEIRMDAVELESSFEEKKFLLGPHTEAISEILELIKAGQSEGNASVEGVRERLLCVADAIEELIAMQLPKLTPNGGKTVAGTGGNGGTSQGNLEVESFCTNIGAMRDGLSLGAGWDGVKQLAGEHREVKKSDGPGYESHHIPSAAVLKEFGINPEEWPTIALTDEDHKDTDSYGGKQRKKHESVFPDVPKSGTYKEEAVKLAETPGGLDHLIYSEILNIRKNHGDKYDGAIAKYLDEVEKYIRKHGIPKRPGKK